MTDNICRSMKDVINFAVKWEENARDYYLRCRDRINSQGLKDFFQELADEEEKHRQLLVARDVDHLEPFEPARVENLKISDFLVEEDFSPDMNYQEALTLAMKKEEKAHAFYTAWQNHCADSETADLFAFLANEELTHKRKLENIFDEDILMWN